MGENSKVLLSMEPSKVMGNLRILMEPTTKGILREIRWKAKGLCFMGQKGLHTMAIGWLINSMAMVSFIMKTQSN